MSDTTRVSLGPVAAFVEFPARVLVGSRSYFVVPHDGSYRLLSTVCPHQGGTVYDEGTRFECPIHNWRFDRQTGRCLNAPSRSLASHSAVVENGELIALLPADAPIDHVRAERSEKTGLTIRLMSHACLELSFNGFTLLTDPWLDGLAFLGAWAPYPPPAESAADLRPDAILLTHEHSDHFHEPTLRKFARHTPVYVPDFPNQRLQTRLSALGFTDVRVMRFGEDTSIAPRWSLTAFEPSSLWNDAMVLIDIDGFRVFDVNDAGINRRIAAQVGAVDLLAIQFSAGASGYPWTWTHLSDEQKVEISTQMCDGKLALIREAAALYGAPSVLPFASHFTLWHPHHIKHAALMKRNTLADVKRTMAGTATQVIDLLPGDVWDVGRAAIRREHDTVAAPNIERYETYFSEQHPASEDLTEADVLTYLERLNDAPEIALCENLSVRMVGRASTGTDVDISFAITNGHLAGLADAPERPNLKMTMPLAVMNAIIKRDLSWDEAFIGYWCEFERHPNVYHAGFWRLFQAPYYQKRVPASAAPSTAPVSRQSIVAELLETYGGDADRVMRRYGLYCRGCLHSTSESLELAARQHGIEDRRVDALVTELTRVVQRAQQ
jgi:CMP-N-acetylneuraminate monooxygenase